ncbi:MAG TPA: bifunctional riboflavin kinase/FAD synthetase [Sediminibacterium sp.]|nr:bifunctional riboflavin kinase/FAD synthetase [Sediminibacterium sp.]
MMQIHRGLTGSLPVFRHAAVTIGTFDGVHLGHRRIIEQLKETARETNGETVIITFDPHPRKVVSSVPGEVRLLTTLPEKIHLLEAAGIDHLVIIPFDHRFASLSATAYVQDFLFAHFHPRTVIIGYDHRFGHNREGDYALMEKSGASLGFAVKEIPEQVVNEVGISSTRIRQAIIAGDIAAANTLLGYPYFFSGQVVAGNRLGRTIGYPTANLYIGSEEKLIPGNGVYAVTAQVDLAPERIKGMMNIGFRPTVDGKKKVIEVNLFDFDQDIYDHSLRVNLHAYLRGETRFDGLTALTAQLGRDKAAAQDVLA